MRKHLALALAATALTASCDRLPTAGRDAGEAEPLAGLSTPTPGVHRVAISPQPVGSDTFFIGALTAQMTFTATAYDAADNPIPGALFAWGGGTGVFSLSSTAGESIEITTTGNGRRPLVVASGTRRDTIYIRVKQNPVSVTLSADSVYVEPGNTFTFTATIVDSLSQPVAGAVARWATSDASVATVADGVVTGVATSSRWVRIRAAYRGLYDYGYVAVRNTPFVGSITVSPAPVDTFLALQRTETYTAEVRDPEGNLLATPVTWSSSNTAVATVDPSTGLVTAVGRGSAYIRATANGVTGSTAVRVLQYSGQVTASMTGSNDPAMAPGGTTTGNASSTDLDGYPIVGAVFDWSSSDNGIATVSPARAASTTVTGVGEGLAVITAARGQGAFVVTDTFHVLVINVPAGIGSSKITTGASAGQGIQVTWTNSSGIETGYRIERSVNGGAFALLTTTAANATSYLDQKAGLTNGDVYAYRIKSCSAAGCSAASGTTQQTW